MTRIDFYVLPDTRPENRMVLACRIAEKAVGKDHRVFINAADETEIRRLDGLMWTFRDGSFLPHAVAGTSIRRPDLHPVTLGCNTEPEGSCDLLINLADDVPSFFSRFERVAELVDADTRCRQQGRERFRFYRDRGYDLNTHKL